MQGFLQSITELVASVRPRSLLEVGCGEGHLARHLWDGGVRPRTFEICDVELDRLAALPPEIHAQQASIYDLPYPDRGFDLVICCEVLEHLEDPAAGLAELARVSERRVLISTPWEPVWRVMNIARGKYLRALGNTPGHVQHFTRRGLVGLARSRLHLIEVRTPLPWTILLGEPRG
jgi:ubiquinone/menaquinone biosynthesis C-methylase UbiE